MEALSQAWAFAPLAVFAALVRWRVARGRAWSDACLEGAVGWLGLVWLLANVLGAAGALQAGPLRVVWALLALGALVWLGRAGRPAPPWPRPRGGLEWALAGGVALLLGLTLLRAALAAPATVDVLNYHLPRQLMWLQQGGLEPFDTINDRENMMPPLAELAGLQFLALTGGDRWANLPQWAAYAGLALGLARLGRVLGAGRAAALLTALLGLLVPMAYHEASNAKNDLLAAFVLVVLTRQLAGWRAAGERVGPTGAAGLGLTAAVATLVKSTALFYAPVLGACALLPWARSVGWARGGRLMALAVAVWALLSAPFFLRNQAWYGSPLGEHRAEDGGAQANEALSPGLLASNALRHATLHLVGPSEALNRAWLAAVARAHSLLGVDENDPRTTLWVLKFRPDYAPAAETVAGAPAHFVIGLPLLLWLLLSARGARGANVRWLAAAVVLGAVAFCAVIKWQPWGARLQIPLFALGLVPLAVWTEAWPAASRRAFGAPVLLLAGAAWWPGADTELRPLWTAPTLWTTTREADFYRAQPQARARDDSIADLARQAGWRTVYRHNLHDIAYPLMRRLRAVSPGLRFAGAPAGRLRDEPPDAIAVLSHGTPLPLYREFAGRDDWRLVGDGEGDGVYVPEAEAARLGWAQRVPRFSGWERVSGLTPGERLQLGGHGVALRRLAPTGAVLGYVGRGRGLRLRAEALRTDRGAAALPLLVSVEGRLLGRFDLAPGDALQAFELELPDSPGPHVVQVQAGGDTEGAELRFARLHLVDEPSAAAPQLQRAESASGP